MSLQRLINLAKKTGDTLIVHDAHGDRDMVIMDVDRYEHLLSDVSFMDDVDTEEYHDEVDPSPWHSTSDLLGGRAYDDRGLYDVSDDMYEMADPVASEDAFTAADISFGEEESTPFDMYGFDADERSSQHLGSQDDKTAELAVEPLGETTADPEQPVEYDAKPVPSVSDVAWQEEELLDDGAVDDEPVFYEEPV